MEQPGADRGRACGALERLLDHVVAPIAAEHPTLLLVMDGLSSSIFRELFSRVASQWWAEWVPDVSPTGVMEPLRDWHIGASR